MKTYDAVIIGGGPAGMTAALYMLRSEASVAFVEKLSPGGQMLMTHKIDNYPGFPDGVEGWKLADAMAAHLDKYKLDRYNDEVNCIEPGEEAHRVRVGQEWIAGKTVILCTGAKYRPLGLPNEKHLVGKGVSYCALCDGNFFRDQVVAVVGGGDSALEESLYLAKLVKKLYLVHRREDFRAQKCYQDSCAVNPVIQIVRSNIVTAITGQDKVEGVVVENVKTGEIKEIEVDGVFIFVGYQPHGDFFPPEIGQDPQGFIMTGPDMSTNIPGLYAAGDIRSKHCRQVTTAVGDGACAAHAAIAYLEKKFGAKG